MAEKSAGILKREKNLRPPWKKGQSGNPTGNPPSKFEQQLEGAIGKKELKKLYRLSPMDANRWDIALLSLTIANLRAIVKDENSPALAKANAVAILTDLKHGRTTTIDRMRDRQFGKATQRIEISGSMDANIFGTPLQNMTTEELKEELARLQSLQADETNTEE